MTEILLYILRLFIYLLLAIFIFNSLYILIYAIAGLKKQKEILTPDSYIKRKFAIFIPSYKEDNIIIDTAINSIKQTYPSEYYDVFIIADKLQPETIQTLKSLPIKVIEVNFDKSTKSKSLNYAMNEAGDNYDIALILDADNIMETTFLEKVNLCFENGCRIVQGHRLAKNLNTTIALLDGISEEINNHIFRKGHRALGLSSALIGSGMAFEYKLYKNYMANVHSVGEDKELEFHLLRDNLKIEYEQSALVYDEKVQHPDSFTNQRRRWINAQLACLRDNAIIGFKKFFLEGNIDLLNKVLQMIILPRILLLGSTFIFTFLLFCLFLLKVLSFNILLLGISILTATALSLIISVPLKFYNTKTLKALLYIPKGFLLMLTALLKIKGAGKQFIHTPHGVKSDVTNKQE